MILDSELSMAQHIRKLSSIYFLHLRRLREFRLVLDSSSMQRLIYVFIMLRLDYCNAVLASLPASTFDPLQCVLNNARRFMVGTAAGDLDGDVVQSLHWLPIA